MPPRDWKIRIKDILDAIERNQRCVAKITVDAVIRNFIVIGEAAAKVPETVRKSNATLPWADMIAMRNFVVHGYFGVSNEVLWNTIQQDLPQLVPHLKALLASSIKIG